jgi:NAD(P)-dependent dehydrogenase (short-subunit alcohol dehydrogenase family)
VERLENKVALVTGGSSGIGRATALVFAKEGAKIVVSDINVAGGEESEVEALVNTAVGTYGRLDCAFNNAGVGGGDWDRVMNVNVKGVWLCMQHEISQMLKQGSGAIVNTSSIVGLVARPNTGMYSSSKHAVVGMTKAIALQYAKNNIRVNAVCPNFVRTPFIARVMARKDEMDGIIADTPMGRIAEPHEIAEAVVWLCSDAASYITGIAMPVDGGYTAH